LGDSAEGEWSIQIDTPLYKNRSTAVKRINEIAEELGIKESANKALRNSLEYEQRCVAAQKAAKTRIKNRIRWCNCQGEG